MGEALGSLAIALEVTTLASGVSGPSTASSWAFCGKRERQTHSVNRPERISPRDLLTRKSEIYSFVFTIDFEDRLIVSSTLRVLYGKEAIIQSYILVEPKAKQGPNCGCNVGSVA